MTGCPQQTDPSHSNHPVRAEIYLFSLNSQVKLVQVNFGFDEFQATYKQTCRLFAKYQMAIHKDSPDKCDELQVSGFFHSCYFT